MVGDVYGKLTIVSELPEIIDDSKRKKLKCLCSCGRTHYASFSHLKTGDVSTCGNCNSHKDIKIGDIFGKLEVVGGAKMIDGKTHYLTKCHCGNPELKYVKPYYLVSTSIKNKGCGDCSVYDLVGKTFEDLTVIKFIERRGKKNIAFYLCLCSCGKECERRRDTLLNGVSKNCGCGRSKATSKARSNDLTGKMFGHLEVLERDGSDKHGNAIFKCLCTKCQKKISIRGSDLKKGQKSCGCVNGVYSEEAAKTRRANTDKEQIGVKRGRLTPIRRALTEKGQQGYLCKCDCGEEKVFTMSSVTGSSNKGKALSCGCLVREKYLESLKSNLIGKEYNRLKVTDIFMKIKKNGGTVAYATADCSCGGENSKGKEYSLYSIQSSHIRSCGCLFDELVGENHWHWNPEMTDEQRKENATRTSDPEYRKWRRAVLKRDKKCQRCGDSSTSLHAHHKVPWCVSNELRFDVSNGIVLCEQCHELFHSVYGQTINAPADLQEFIEVM